MEKLQALHVLIRSLTDSLIHWGGHHLVCHYSGLSSMLSTEGMKMNVILALKELTAC